MTKKQILSLITAISMLTSMNGCSWLDDDDSISTSGNLAGMRSTHMSVSNDGELSITRSQRDKTVSMGEANTWTIFVYMCGSDLESDDSGMASMDIEEMMEASSADNYRFVVQTGGAYDWVLDEIDSDKNERLVIENGNAEIVEEQAATNMGEAETLADFINWGVENYSADNMGVVFWNHGGGSISGVCFDEQEDSDSLSLVEIDNALTNVYDNMTDKFEFIGFDACLMGTIETANILVPHANYMYASEETEPGYGWDYTAIGDYLSQNPSADGAELGKVVCDSFYQACADIDSEDMATLSCIDLSKIEPLVNSFNSVAENMCGVADDSSKVSNIIRGITGSENYGGNNKAEGYTNMVDMGHIMENISSSVSGTDEVLACLDDCVVYKVNGDGRQNAHGLSMYYPLCVDGSEELNIFKNICISPYYIQFIDELGYSSANDGILDDYDSSIWFDNDTSLFWSDDIWDCEYFDSSDNSDEYNFDIEDSPISFSQNPYTNDDGVYGVTISADTIDYVDSVLCNIFMYYEGDDGEEVYLDLGSDNYVNVDWNTGDVTDCFDGTWFTLNDGQPLTMYLIEETENYNIYTSPIKLNGEDTNLRIKMEFTDDDYSIKILGAWNGVDSETGQASKDIVKLKAGDIIVPYYCVYTDTSVEEMYIDGEEYIYDGNNDIYEETLPECDYLYGFEFIDIYGSSLYTDLTVFNVEDGEVYFYE